MNYFASGNTGIGFVDYFDYINEERNGFQYILKGSCGSGKSTLMNTIGNYFESKGFEIERFFCSSDSESLDAIRIVEKNISIIDGTSPHTRDATFPQILNKTIDLSECISSEIKVYEKEILELAQKKKKCFELVYSFLKIANKLNHNNNLLLDYNNSKNDLEKEKEVDSIVENILQKLNIKNKNLLGKERKLFLDCITKNGEYSLEEKNNFNIVLEFEIENCLMEKVFEKLKERLIKSGCNIISFFSIISPDRRKSIYIENENIYIKINRESFQEKYIFYKNIENNCKNMQKYLKKAGFFLNYAKYFHKKMEKKYYKYIDFDRLDKITNDLLRKIEQQVI